MLDPLCKYCEHIDPCGKAKTLPGVECLLLTQLLDPTSNLTSEGNPLCPRCSEPEIEVQPLRELTFGFQQSYRRLILIECRACGILNDRDATEVEEGCLTFQPKVKIG